MGSMSKAHLAPVTPDLRIVAIERIYPHEAHDPQRSSPLLSVIGKAETLTNPPLVAMMGEDDYVILDGANRLHTFKQLGYEHLLVQIVDYDSPYVDLSVWRHVVSDWDEASFMGALEAISDVDIQRGWHPEAIAQILFRQGDVVSLMASHDDIHTKNRVLRGIVGVYHHRATLYRTALNNPQEIWGVYPQALAFVMFAEYEASDIIEAARSGAYLPPGVSRHLIHGRALMVNYPLASLREDVALDVKNAHLRRWIQERFAKRNVRYYAESTYHFSE